MTDNTLLFRQAHPNFMDGELITSQVFMPNSEDDGKLSVYDGDLTTAEDSYRHYTDIREKESDSVWSVTKTEAQSQEVPAESNAEDGNPAHAILDFTGKSANRCRKIAKQLKRLALAHGCQFRPTAS